MPSIAETQAASARKKRHVSLALQGGGAFSTFTWGVLDRLLDDGDAVSGASAGSVNLGELRSAN